MGEKIQKLIEGVQLERLETFEDDRGRVCHIKKSSQFTNDIQEVYISTCKPEAVKAWHCHLGMTLNYVCLKGQVVVYLVDLRPDSSTFGAVDQIWLTDPYGENYRLLTIPPLVWNGYRAYGSHIEEVMIANVADMIHHPNEIVRVHPRNFPVQVDWGEYKIAG